VSTLPGGALHDVLALLLRRWRVIAGTFAVVVGATALYCLLATPSYRARAMILIEGRSPELVGGQRTTPDDDAFTSSKYDYYQTQFELLQSTSLATRVIDELKLADNGSFAAEGETLNTYLDELVVQPVRGTRLVTVEFSSTDAALSALVANTHARLFVRGGLERMTSAMDQVRGFLEQKLDDLQRKLQAAETAVLRFQSQHQLLPIDLSKDVASERLMDLSRRLTAAEAERISLEAQYRLVKDGETDGLPAVLASPLIQKLREEYNRLEVEHALLAARYTKDYPGRQQVAGQLARARQLLDSEIRKVARGVEANYTAAERTVEKLTAELDSQRGRLIDRKDEDGELLTKMREVETTRALHDNLLARVKDLDVLAGAEASNMNIVEAAKPPKWPSTPNTRMNLLLAGITGLVLGTGMAFVRDGLDGTIRDAAELRRMTGVGTLAVIPDLDAPPPGTPRERLLWHATRARQVALHGWHKVSGNGHTNGNGAHPQKRSRSTRAVVSLANGHSAALAEAYRTLRTSLLLGDTSRHVLLVTSAAGGAGKTSTSVNTAAALAACGARVLLIDGDLRLPCCHRALGAKLAPGLGDFLTGAYAQAPIQQTSVANLSLLSAGQPLASPTELLSSPRMRELMERVRDAFEFVIVDSPPLLAVSDALLLGRLVDGVVLITERGRTRREELASALERLRESGVAPLGAVLNRGPLGYEYYRYSRPEAAEA
jgi:capsular exopolysaccharide synthesis family protein